MGRQHPTLFIRKVVAMSEKCNAHDNFEYRIGQAEIKIEDMDGRLVELEKDSALESQRSNMLFENTMKAISDLSCAITSLKNTNSDIQNTLLGMQSEMKEANTQTDDIKKKLDKLSDKVCTIDDESKFNLRIWFREKFPYIAVLVASGTSLGLLISALIK